MQSFSNYNRFDGFFETMSIYICEGYRLEFPRKIIDGLNLSIGDYSEVDFNAGEQLIVAIWSFLNCQLREVAYLDADELVILYDKFVVHAKPVLADYEKYVKGVIVLLEERMAEIYKDELLMTKLITGGHKDYYSDDGGSHCCENCIDDDTDQINILENSFNAIMLAYNISTFVANIYKSNEELNYVHGKFLVPICNSEDVKNVDILYCTIVDIIMRDVRHINSLFGLETKRILIKNDDFISIFIKGDYVYDIGKYVIKPSLHRTLVCVDSDDED
jgi:hypothetical protein